MLNYGQKRTTCHRRNRPKQNELRAGGVTQSGISSDLDQFEEPTADPEAPEPGADPPRVPEISGIVEQVVRVEQARFRVKYDYETQ